jgi:L-fuconate dehydratase
MAAIRQGVRPVQVASGEHAANRVVFKQFLQARATDVMQIAACNCRLPAEAVTVT